MVKKKIKLTALGSNSDSLRVTGQYADHTLCGGFRTIYQRVLRNTMLAIMSRQSPISMETVASSWNPSQRRGVISLQWPALLKQKQQAEPGVGVNTTI